MRNSLLAVLVLFSLACSGVTPVSDVVTPEVAVPPQPEGLPAMLVWTRTGNTCRLQERPLDKPTDDGVIATFTVAPELHGCSPAWSYSRHGDQLAIAADDDLILANLATKKFDILPVPADSNADGFGFDEKGVLRATRGLIAELDTTAGKPHFMLGSETIDAPDGEYADVLLCADYTWTEGAWRRDKVSAVGLAEGSYPPYCDGVTYKDLVQPGQGVGGEVLTTELSADLPAPPHEGLARISALADAPVVYASGHDWMEGEYLLGPVMVFRDGAWSPLEGIQQDRGLYIQRVGAYFLACTGDDEGLYELATGKRLWSGETGLCPSVLANTQ